MGKVDDTIVLSPKTQELLASRRKKCFLCKYVLEDFRKNGRLTDHPLDSNGGGLFPVKGKLKHVNIEKRCASRRKGAKRRRVKSA